MSTIDPQPQQSQQQQQQSQQSDKIVTISIDDFKTHLQLVQQHDVLPEAIESLDTLYVYLTNLINAPMEVKYHTISAVNIHFYERLGHLHFCEPLLASIGYIRSTQPIPHFRFNIELLSDVNRNATIESLRTIFGLVEALRAELNVQYKVLPHIPSTDVPMSCVLAAGRFADRGRRATMEDQEAIIDHYYTTITTDIARLYTEYVLLNAPADWDNTKLNNVRKDLQQHFEELFPQYENLGFFAVYDGHGGTDTAEFVVKFLHQSIKYEIKQYIQSILNVGLLPQIAIKQQTQYLHITDQFLRQLPVLNEIQHISTDDINSTDFSGKSAFLFYEDLISKFINNGFNTTPTSPIVPVPSNELNHPVITCPSPATLELLDDKSKLLASTYTNLTHDIAAFAPSSTTFAEKLSAIAPTRLLTKALFQAHVRTDNQLRRCLALHSGCTTVTCIIGKFAGQRFIISGNCGDSRAVLATQSSRCCRYASLPRDKKPHVFLRQLTPSNDNPAQLLPTSPSMSPLPPTSTTIQYSTQFSDSPQSDPVLSKAPLPLDRLRSIRTSAFQYGDIFVSKNARVTAQRLTLDHKPSILNETNRISSLGGFVSGTGRTMGVLAVSRALGDHGLKNTKHFVSSRPHVDLQCISDHDDNVAQNPFLLLACDGVWDVVRDEDALLFIAGAVTTSVRLWLQMNNIQVCLIDKDVNNEQKSKHDPASMQTDTTEDIVRKIEAVTFHSDHAATHFDLDHQQDGDEKNGALGEARNAICHTCLQRSMPQTVLNNIMQFASQRLVELALVNGSTDNVTAMTLRL